MSGYRDALFIGHNGTAERHFAAAAGGATEAQSAAVRFPDQALALSRGHGLSVAGAALSLRAAGRGQPDNPDGRHRDHHGELRSRALPPARRAMGYHSHAAGADDVLAHAEAAGGGAHALRPLLARDR